MAFPLSAKTMEASRPLMSDTDSNSEDTGLDNHDDIEKAGQEAPPYEDHAFQESDIELSLCKTSTLCMVFLRRTRYYLLSTIILVILALIFLVFTQRGVVNHSHNHHHHDYQMPTSLSAATIPGTTCGTSNAEALALNCTFDPITYAWMPPLCYHADLAADALSPASRFAVHNKAGIFAWYGDKDGLEQVPQDPTLLRERAEIWATRNWHQAHCLYFWRLLGRAIDTLAGSAGEERGGWVLSQGLVFAHTLHCNDMLADKVSDGGDLIRTLRVYGICVRVGEVADATLEHGDFVVDPDEVSGAGR